MYAHIIVLISWRGILIPRLFLIIIASTLFPVYRLNHQYSLNVYQHIFRISILHWVFRSVFVVWTHGWIKKYLPNVLTCSYCITFYDTKFLFCSQCWKAGTSIKGSSCFLVHCLFRDVQGGYGDATPRIAWKKTDFFPGASEQVSRNA